MVLFMTLIILVTVCGEFTMSFPMQFTIPKASADRIFENDSTPSDPNEMFSNYYSIADHKEEELNVISQFQETNLDKINYIHVYNINGNTYLLAKTMRHRNKRYASYLTICPFKICSMGRKRMRTRRYIETIKAIDDNEGT